MERREHTRYAVRALVDFEWMAEGVLRQGRGFTKDISSKGMFVYSDSEPPSIADLQVEVYFRSAAEGITTLQLRATALVIRVELATSPGAYHGFAILNKSYKLHVGLTVIDD